VVVGTLSTGTAFPCSPVLWRMMFSILIAWLFKVEATTSALDFGLLCWAFDPVLPSLAVSVTRCPAFFALCW